MRNRWIVLVALLLTVVAAAFRLPALGNRPMHGDEAVHAFKFRELWERHVYRYDPNEFHGPTLYYAALPSVVLRGRRDFAETQEADYRLPIALFGAAMVLLLLPLADGLGGRAAIGAGILTAVSPAFVFYSRTYIQETLLAFFTLGVLACGWRYTRSRRPGWLLAAGLCAGLMIATKETAVLAFGAFAVALWASAAWTRRVDGYAPNLRRLWNGRLVAPAAFVALLTACLFLSGFLSNPSGPLDYLRSYTPWLRRAHGTALHREPFDYYLKLLLWNHTPHEPIWSEGLIIGLAVVGLIAALLPKAKSRLEGSAAFARFVAFTTLALTVAYSAIPYKTPWCVLSFLNGMILLAGIGAAALIRLAPGRLLKAGVVLMPPAPRWRLRRMGRSRRLLRAGVVALLLAGSVQLGWQAYQSGFIHFADQSNPYVYAQPVPDILNLERRMEELAHACPQRHAMVVKVFSVDTYYWPLPWYLRRFPNVGYWTQVPLDADAPVVIASPEFEDVLTQKLTTHVMTHIYGLRPGVFLEMWVRMDLWKTYLETRKPAKEEEPGD